MANKHEQKGAQLRREGRPKPPRKEESWLTLTTAAEVRARDDERNGWTRENDKRTARSKKKS